MSAKESVKEKATDLYRKYSEQILRIRKEAVEGKKWVSSGIIGFNGYQFEITASPSGVTLLRFVSPNKRNSFVVANADAVDALIAFGKWLEENKMKVNTLLSVLGAKTSKGTQQGEFEL